MVQKIKQDTFAQAARSVRKSRATRWQTSRAVRWSPRERIVLTFTICGMAASLIALLSARDATISQVTAEQGAYTGDVVKTPLYYGAHAAEILLLTVAGLVALWTTDWRTIERGYQRHFFLFLAAGLLMAARGYSVSDLLSTRLMDATGPFVCVISVVAFIAARRKNWIILSKVIAAMAVLLSAVAIVLMAGLQTGGRQEAGLSLTTLLNALYWPASWLCLQDHPRGSFMRRVRFGPVAIYAVGSVFTQTRLNFVMLFVLLVAYSYLEVRRRRPQAATWIIGLGVAAWISLCAAAFFRDTTAFQKVDSAATALYARLGDDSRTGQLEWFAESVRPSELVLGRGSFATWQWGKTVWRGGTDVGYLTLLFYGGVPLLLTYVLVHIRPAVAVLRANRPGWQLTAAAVVGLWAIRMLSSAYPGLTLEYYPILFCVGACISRQGEGLGRGSAFVSVPRSGVKRA